MIRAGYQDITKGLFGAGKQLRAHGLKRDVPCAFTPSGGQMPKVKELIPEVLRNPEIELTPRRLLAKRAWELSDQLLDAPGILFDLLVESQHDWIEDNPVWPDRVMRARSCLQRHEECHGGITRAAEQGILPPRLIIVGGLGPIAERQRGIPPAAPFVSIRVASEIKGESIAFATRARSICVRGLPMPGDNPLRWTLPHADGTGASFGTEASSPTATGHEGSRSSTDAAPATQDFASYRGEGVGHTAPFERGDGPYASPSVLPASRFPTEIVVDREMGLEWQRIERMELADYRVPYGFHCDPKSHPEGGDWLEACPRSFQWLDRQHGITARPVTGLELCKTTGART